VLQGLSSLGLKVLSWAELENMGKAKPCPPQPPKPADLSTIMYTSGTTGE
jgi:long-chain acyl-CoA synthetase